MLTAMLSLNVKFSFVIGDVEFSKPSIECMRRYSSLFVLVIGLKFFNSNACDCVTENLPSLRYFSNNFIYRIFEFSSFSPYSHEFAIVSCFVKNGPRGPTDI